MRSTRFPKPGVQSGPAPRRRLNTKFDARLMTLLGESPGRGNRILRTEMHPYPDGSVQLVRLDDEGCVVESIRLFASQVQKLIESLR